VVANKLTARKTQDPNTRISASVAFTVSVSKVNLPSKKCQAPDLRSTREFETRIHEFHTHRFIHWYQIVPDLVMHLKSAAMISMPQPLIFGASGMNLVGQRLIRREYPFGLGGYSFRRCRRGDLWRLAGLYALCYPEASFA
jgi:hypothetical protein